MIKGDRSVALVDIRVLFAYNERSSADPKSGRIEAC